MLFVEAITYFSVMQFGADSSKTRQSPSANDMGEITGRTRSRELGPHGGICGRGLTALAVPGGHCRLPAFAAGAWGEGKDGGGCVAALGAAPGWGGHPKGGKPRAHGSNALPAAGAQGCPARFGRRRPDTDAPRRAALQTNEIHVCFQEGGRSLQGTEVRDMGVSHSEMLQLPAPFSHQGASLFISFPHWAFKERPSAKFRWRARIAPYTHMHDLSFSEEGSGARRL